jgi:hypothetical protein
MHWGNNQRATTTAQERTLSACSHLSAVATYDDRISVSSDAPSLSLNSLAELKS